MSSLRQDEERAEERESLKLEMRLKLEEVDGRLHALITENEPTGREDHYSDTLINDSTPGNITSPECHAQCERLLYWLR